MAGAPQRRSSTDKETIATDLDLTPQDDSDVHKGAIEGDRSDDEQQANRNVPALNSDGLPANPTAIAEGRAHVLATPMAWPRAHRAPRTASVPTPEEAARDPPAQYHNR